MKMRLKENVDMVAFLNQAEKCGQDIFLETREGDLLNLKSVLSGYVLIVLSEKKELLKDCTIICNKEDAIRMEIFLEP
ncbi:MAG: hypothetical protein LUF27_07270 [Lachnospiraceae bacterium]|nr:hypothetical protein [Lachnospiraceae bacterium]